MLRTIRHPLLIASPAFLLLGAMIAERISVYALAANPSSAFLWHAVLAMRGNLERIHFVLADIYKLPLPLQLAIFAVAGAALLYAVSTRATRVLFLVAHVVAIAAVLLAFEPSSRAASIRTAMNNNEFYLDQLVFHFSVFQQVLIGLAALSCVLAHVMLCRELFARQHRVARLRMALAFA